MTSAQAADKVDELHRVTEQILPTHMKLGDALKRSAAVVEAFFAVEFRVFPEELSASDKAVKLPGSKIRWQHVVWCCRHLVELYDAGETEKAVRWLGFVQGCAWASNLVSVSQLALLWPDDGPAWSTPLLPTRTTDESRKRTTKAVNVVRLSIARNNADAAPVELTFIGKMMHSPPRDSKVTHTLWCCDRVAAMAGESPVKANLWLGFVQGVAWTFGYLSIDELRASLHE